jgi:hypothetical protein
MSRFQNETLDRFQFSLEAKAMFALVNRESISYATKNFMMKFSEMKALNLLNYINFNFEVNKKI